MHTLEIVEKGIMVQLPESWDEMSHKQAHYCLKQANLLLEREISETTFLIRCFYHLANIKRDFISVIWERIIPEDKVLTKNANAFLLAEKLLAFMFKETLDESGQILSREFCYETVINQFSTFKVGGKVFTGPQDLLADISFAEFRTALEELTKFLETRDRDQLCRLLAVLYRPQLKNLKHLKKRTDYNGKTKVLFNANRVEADSKLLAWLPVWQLNGMLLHFTYCVHYIKENDIELEGRVLNFSPLFPKPKATDVNAKPKPSTGWAGVLFGIAEKGVFGNAEHTDQTNLFDILIFLFENYLQNKEIEKRQAS